MNLLGRLNLWLQEVGAEVDDFSEELLEGFVVRERARDFVHITVTSSVGTMRRFLTDVGILRVVDADARRVTPAQAAVAQW